MTNDQEKEWQTVHAEISINKPTLEAYGSYVDFLYLQEEKNPCPACRERNEGYVQTSS